MPLVFALLLVLLVTKVSLAQTPRPTRLDELKQLSIEELVDTDVTTASRRAERLADVAAAVTVITGEDLRRMGVTTLPEALRLAGHLQIAHVSGPQYVVSARGFAITTTNKLLVLIDGRTVYSPVFGGTFWETQDVVVPDIDRIEITRGPGGSVWGANAMNGVINVITKKAADTRGTLVSLGAGSSVLGPFAVRHGDRLGDAGSYRAYAKVRFEDSHQLASGADAGDDFDFGQAGFRIESDQAGNSTMFLQGDIYAGTTGVIDGTEANLSGGNLLARWTSSYGGHSSSIQAYYDHTYRRVPNYRGVLDTVDLDAQHQWQVGRNQLVFGAGYRRYDGDDLGDGPGYFFEPRERTSNRFNAFAQNEVNLGRGLFVSVGSKFERNEFTGLEIQPTVRARWSSSRSSVWGAVSRAVRVPTRVDTDLRVRVPDSTSLRLIGSADFLSESVVAYEAGYRRQFRDRISIDLAGYVNRYDDLRTQELRPAQPVLLANMMNALTRGVESTLVTQILPRWQVNASHVYLWKELTFDAGSRDATRGVSEGNDPRHIVNVRSYITATNRIEIDAFYRHYGALPSPAVDAYQEVDARIGFRVAPGWDLSLIGDNLLHDRHVEFRGSTPPEAYERSVSLRSVWRF